MGLFGKKEQKKKQEDSSPTGPDTSELDQIAEHIRKRAEAENLDRNLVNDLCSYFDSKEEVTGAWFGMIRNEQDNQQHLFLGVEHAGDLHTIKQMTYFLKQIHLPETSLNFVSSEDRPEFLEFLQKSSFPFYKKGEILALNRSIMHSWFSGGSENLAVMAQMRKERLFTVIEDSGNFDKAIRFQLFGRNGRDFVTIFSDKTMPAKCGLTTIPKGQRLIEFDWAKVVGNSLDMQHLVVNPGTPFEVELN